MKLRVAQSGLFAYHEIEIHIHVALPRGEASRLQELCLEFFCVSTKTHTSSPFPPSSSVPASPLDRRSAGARAGASLFRDLLARDGGTRQPRNRTEGRDRQAP